MSQEHNQTEQTDLDVKISTLLFQLKNIFQWVAKKLNESFVNKTGHYFLGENVGTLTFINNKLYLNNIDLNSKKLETLTIKTIKLILKSIPNLIKELEK